MWQLCAAMLRSDHLEKIGGAGTPQWHRLNLRSFRLRQWHPLLQSVCLRHSASCALVVFHNVGRMHAAEIQREAPQVSEHAPRITTRVALG